jgi:hypothetical protein
MPEPAMLPGLACNHPRYARLVLRVGGLSALLATVISAVAIVVLSAANPTAGTRAPGAWDVAPSLLLLLPIPIVSCGPFGFLAGNAGSAFVTLRQRRIRSRMRLWGESATLGFLLGFIFPFFDRIVNRRFSSGGAMLWSAPIGMLCALVCVTAPDSLGNPVVHSLSVTLGNHAILPFQPYNCPCPTGHLNVRVRPRDVFPGR